MTCVYHSLCTFWIFRCPGVFYSSLWSLVFCRFSNDSLFPLRLIKITAQKNKNEKKNRSTWKNRNRNWIYFKRRKKNIYQRKKKKKITIPAIFTSASKSLFPPLSRAKKDFKSRKYKSKKKKKIKRGLILTRGYFHCFLIYKKQNKKSSTPLRLRD